MLRSSWVKSGISFECFIHIIFQIINLGEQNGGIDVEKYSLDNMDHCIKRMEDKVGDIFVIRIILSVIKVSIGYAHAMGQVYHFHEAGAGASSPSSESGIW